MKTSAAFKYEMETRRTVRYKEIRENNDSPLIFGVLRILKAAFQDRRYPASIHVRITPSGVR